MRSPAAPPPADPRPLDLNRATVAELARLPGVGPGLAQRIFDERERRGRFDSPEALRHVVGVGPKKLAALRDLVTVGE
jgi:competence protein ComEA